MRITLSWPCFQTPGCSGTLDVVIDDGLSNSTPQTLRTAARNRLRDHDAQSPACTVCSCGAGLTGRELLAALDVHMRKIDLLRES